MTAAGPRDGIAAGPRVGIVVVSHSRALADAAVALAGEMAPDLPVTVAAGLEDGSFGTDAIAVAEAVTAADTGAGVVVLMDLGSAVLSAEVALDVLADPDLRERVLLCPAPLVEGLVVAAVAASGGADRATVSAQAADALAAKREQLGGPTPAPPGPPPPATAGRAVSGGFTVADPHGLHARPAAHLLGLLTGLDAQVRLRNATTGSDWVPADGLTRVATLGARHGHRVDVTAEGPDAGVAVAAVVALGRGAADGPPAPSAPEPVPAPAAAPSGGAHPMSPGVAVGPAHRPVVDPVAVPDEPGRGAGAEHARLDAAIAAVRATTTEARDRLRGDRAAVFAAHLLLLDDPELAGAARAAVDAGAAAARAWADAVARTAAAFTALPDPYLAARAADVEAVGEQVLRVLVGAPAGQAAPPGSVLVAGELTPAEALATPAAGVVLAGGSATDHSAVLLRGRGVPAVCGAGEAALTVPAGTPVALDGATGELVLDPPEPVLADFRDRAAARAAAQDAAQVRANDPAVTRGGVRVHVGVNAGSVADVTAGMERGADMVGLLRTEFLFLGRATAPDVDEQEAAYREVVAAADGRPVVLRTLDVGGDKPLPYLPLPVEANPFLGLRGLRLAAVRPDLLATQLRAAVRAARAAPLSVMFPMVATVDELLAARNALDEAVATEGGTRPDGLRVGMMVEVPAAAAAAAEFVPHVDFLSIGTNDLVQYALAAERGNPAVAHLADPLHPGVLALVDAVCRAAGERVPVAVCGEAAADPRAAERFVALGVRELSVAPPAVAAVKQAVREM